MARKANPNFDVVEEAKLAPEFELMENAISEVGGEKISAKVPEKVDAPIVPVKKYLVVCPSGGKNVLMNGYKALLRDGKVIEDKDYDIAALREQGVMLKELA